MSRELTSHKTNDCNKAIKIEALGEPGPGGANQEYLLTYGYPDRNEHQVLLKFQQGNPAEGINGITNEALLAVVEDRLKGFEDGPFTTIYNSLALQSVQLALYHLQGRTMDRVKRGVEGQQVQ